MPEKIPSVTDPVWRNIVLGKTEYSLEFVAVRIFLGHTMIKVQHSSSPEAMAAKAAKELWQLYDKNIALSSVQRDLEKISAGR